MFKHLIISLQKWDVTVGHKTGHRELHVLHTNRHADFDRASKAFCHKSLASSTLYDIPVVRDYPNVFPEELPGMPPERDIEFVIELTPGTSRPSRPDLAYKGRERAK